MNTHPIPKFTSPLVYFSMDSTRTPAQRSKDRGPKRWQTLAGILRVARLLKQQWPELRRVLDLDGHSAEELPMAVQQIAALTEESAKYPDGSARDACAELLLWCVPQRV